MRIMSRNKQTFHYADPDGKICELSANVSSGSGNAFAGLFGNDATYSRVILTDDLSLPIKSQTMLWIETDPANNEQPDYYVSSVSKSLNVAAYAINKVNHG